MEIKNFVKRSDKFSDDPEKIKKINKKFAEKMEHLESLYKSKLDVELEKMFGSQYSNMTASQKSEMTSHIISEKFKIHMQEKFETDMVKNNEGISVLGFEILPSAYAVCNTQPTITHFKQVKVDIDGQFGFEGQNELQTVEKRKLSSCLTKYTLTFADEDYPIPGVDQVYDQIRINQYDRIEDIESFYVSNGKVVFVDSGSKNETFFIVTPPGHHYDSNAFSNTVYVSNTWNHMMDTSNTNPNIPLKTWIK